MTLTKQKEKCQFCNEEPESDDLKLCPECGQELCEWCWGNSVALIVCRRCGRKED